VTAPAWTDARRVLLLTLLREGREFRQAARDLACTEAEAREQAAIGRAAGLLAIGAKRRMQEPAPTRRCCACRQPFAPRTRFFFRCDPCRTSHAGVYA
jgi:Zn finger protein HypA/HybF involved in hydrogenase expression